MVHASIGFCIFVGAFKEDGITRASSCIWSAFYIYIMFTIANKYETDLMGIIPFTMQLKIQGLWNDHAS